HLNPLVPSNTSYLLWMLLGFLVVGAVLVVSLRRVGDMFGRVRVYNLGFAVFTAGCVLLSVTWMHGSAGALWMIVMRIVQGIGAAFLFANSSAILTDAFPPNERGLALGINMVAAIAALAGGVAVLVVFALIEQRVKAPMFRLHLFKIRAFSAGTLATLLSALARGGLMFMLIIWLQGIWLPEHGYSFSSTPLWAGI